MPVELIARVLCPDLRFWRDPPGLGRMGTPPASARTNLPGPRVVHHSPDGYEWGYGGSGPADLALNILAHCLPVGCDRQPALRLFEGDCSQIAWLLHQEFKRHFLAGMAFEGDTIPGRAVDSWLDEWLEDPDFSAQLAPFDYREDVVEMDGGV